MSIDHSIQAYGFSKLLAKLVLVIVGGSHGIVAAEVAKADLRICVVLFVISLSWLSRPVANHC